MLSWLLVSVGVIVGRFVLRRIVQNMRANGRFLTAALIIGANEEGLAIAEQLQANPKAGVWLAGFVDDELGPGSELLPDVPVLGSVDGIGSLVRQHGIQEIIVASTALPREKLLQLFTAFGSEDNITIRMSSGLYELLTTGVEVQEFGNVPLLSVNKVRLTGADMTMKSMLDLTLSIGSLIVFLPIMVAMAIAIRLDSPGPIFHLRGVVGVGGKRFNAFKFRTMYVDADERLARDPELRREFELNHKLKNDPRVTRIGRFLRRTSLDELPQLINVLLGQMSLVGPRMITEEERVRYGKFRMNLSTVKPGITGLWQVSGRSDVSYEERVMLDMNYIRNYSIWFDLHILWQTIPAVLKSRGAY
ncbi:MAG: sugar transferase [Anaerolineales bacterium]|nr:sugar transferase [Anaerolineales bacterium]